MKKYLPVLCALVFSVALFTIDATQYRNPANEVDLAKSFGAFATLWGLFSAFFKANPVE